MNIETEKGRFLFINPCRNERGGRNHKDNVMLLENNR